MRMRAPRGRTLPPLGAFMTALLEGLGLKASLGATAVGGRGGGGGGQGQPRKSNEAYVSPRCYRVNGARGLA
jgi:hypothetical protein